MYMYMYILHGIARQCFPGCVPTDFACCYVSGETTCLTLLV